MKERYLIIDVARCENCNNCFLACKDEHAGNEWPGYAASQPGPGPAWIRIEGKERGQYPLVDVAYLPVPCMHCEDAPCMSAAKDGAVYRRPDGIVMIDPLKARGQEQLVASCPYHAINWNEKAQTAQKCTMCAHLLDKGWEKTRCIQSCPTGALTMRLLEPSDMEALAATESLQVLSPEKKSRPRVYYKNLFRYTRCFIGGTVATGVDGKEECAAGAEAILLFEGTREVARQTTDAFGDFKFDGLEEGKGTYRVRVVYEGRQATTGPIELTGSVNTGVIRI